MTVKGCELPGAVGTGSGKGIAGEEDIDAEDGKCSTGGVDVERFGDEDSDDEDDGADDFEGSAEALL